MQINVRPSCAKRIWSLPDKETERDGKAYTAADARTRDAKRVLKTMLSEGQDGEVSQCSEPFYVLGNTARRGLSWNQVGRAIRQNWVSRSSELAAGYRIAVGMNLISMMKTSRMNIFLPSVAQSIQFEWDLDISCRC